MPLFKKSKSQEPKLISSNKQSDAAVSAPPVSKVVNGPAPDPQVSKSAPQPEKVAGKLKLILYEVRKLTDFKFMGPKVRPFLEVIHAKGSWVSPVSSDGHKWKNVHCEIDIDLDEEPFLKIKLMHQLFKPSTFVCIGRATIRFDRLALEGRSADIWLPLVRGDTDEKIPVGEIHLLVEFKLDPAFILERKPQTELEQETLEKLSDSLLLVAIDSDDEGTMLKSTKTPDRSPPCNSRSPLVGSYSPARTPGHLSPARTPGHMSPALPSETAQAREERLGRLGEAVGGSILAEVEAAANGRGKLWAEAMGPLGLGLGYGAQGWQWEFKWSDKADEEAEVHGPNETVEMLTWAKQGYFVGELSAWVRTCGTRTNGYDSTRPLAVPKFVKSSSIDFQAYL